MSRGTLVAMGAAAERRERLRDEFRREIVGAARRIVVEDGYAALTMRRIGEAIGYSAASIYQYFANRDAIAGALMEEGFVELVEAFAPAATIADPLSRLKAVGRAYVRFGLTRPETYRLMFMEDPKITAGVLEGSAGENSAGMRAYAAILEPLVQLFERGRLRDDLTPPVAADVMWISLHGLVSLKLTCPKFPATPDDALLDATMETLACGLLQ